MEVVPFMPVHAAEAAALFVASLETVRSNVPAMPADHADIDVVAERLADMSGVAAFEDGRLCGYLTAWFPIADFRGTDRRGSYSPEWSHGAVAAGRSAIERAMYRSVSVSWAEAGCDVHAITLLDDDPGALETWFWSGFGMGTVDAVRPMVPIGSSATSGFAVRRAVEDDVAVLAALDIEHSRHLEAAPVFMVPSGTLDADDWSTFLALPVNTAWLAEDESGPFGFIRFDREFGGADVVESAAGVFISGAYVRAEHRRRSAASAILDAAIRHYAAAGLAFCAVDFEAFNPEAATFWLRHFTPVCHSLMRTPETKGRG